VKFSSEPIVTNQIEWHPYLDESAVQAVCKKHGIAVTAYCPIARVRAVGDEILTRVGAKYGKDRGPSLAALAHPEGRDRDPRTSKVERLTENMTIFDFKLSAADMAEIDTLANRRPRRQGRLGAGVGLTSAVRSLSPFLRGEDGERSEPGEGHG